MPATFDSGAEPEHSRARAQQMARMNVAKTRVARALSMFSSASEHVSSRLLSVVVEPLFLSLVSRCLFNETDVEM